MSRAFKVTAKWLESIGACQEEVNQFKKVFPRGAALTEANVEKADKNYLTIHFLEREMLTPRAYGKMEILARIIQTKKWSSLKARYRPK